MIELLATAVLAAGSYDLTITTEAGVQTQTTLTCKPTGGAHPHAKPACRQLAKARGDIAAIPPADGLCTTEYAPVTVRAAGRWSGTGKEYEKIFSNRCVANLQTGGQVFNF